MSWIEGERLAFGYFEVPGGYEEPEEAAAHEIFVYVLSGSMSARCGAEARDVSSGDIVYVPRGERYRFAPQAPFVRYALVRSTPYLERRIDSIAEEAAQARVNLKPN